MSYIIAITGKGGVGKTTVAGLCVSYLIRNGMTPVLAVDADPNSCLDMQLGVRVEKSVGTVREEARQIASGDTATGIPKRELLELKISECLVESENFDMIAMGRSEGPGCYCYANNVLGAVIREIAGNYPYVVIDNEAGLENLSRRIVQKVDLLVMVGDPSMNGIRTIERLYELAREMGIEYRRLAVIINRVREGGETAEMRTIMETTKADRLALLPSDDEIAEAGEKGMSLFKLASGNRVAREIDRMLNDVMKEKNNG